MASTDPSDPQNTSEVWKMLRSAFGEAFANGIIVFFVIAGIAWVVLSLLEKAGNLAKSLSGENVVSSADVGEITLAVGVVLLFAVVFAFGAISLSNRKEIAAINRRLTRIEQHLGIPYEDEETEAD